MAVDQVIRGLDQGEISSEDYRTLQSEATTKRESISGIAVQAEIDAINKESTSDGVDIALGIAKRNANILPADLDKLTTAANNRKTTISTAAINTANSNSQTAVDLEIAKIKAAVDSAAVDAAVAAAKALSEILSTDHSKLDDAATARKDELRIAGKRKALTDNAIADVTSASQDDIDALQVAINDVGDDADEIDTTASQLQVDQATQVNALKAASTDLQAALANANFQGTAADATPVNIQAAIDKVEEEKEDLMDALDAADDLSDAQKQQYQTVHDGVDSQVAHAEERFTIAKTAADKAKENADKARTALGKAMYAALAGPADSGNALNNNEASASPTFNTDGDLMVNVADGAGAIPDGASSNPPSATLEAGAAVDPLSGWKGMDYAHSTGTGDDKYDDHEARVYHNQGAPTTRPFTGGTNPVYPTLITTSGPTQGTLLIIDSGTVASDRDIDLVMADAFNHQGTQQHGSFPTPENDSGTQTAALLVRGTYHGAPGVFRCTGTCSSTNNGSGAPGALGGTWHFKPDSDAMVSEPDANYLYFGWWVHKDSDDDPLAASAFAGRSVADSGDSSDGLDLAVGLTETSFNGSSATYTGAAVGKYAFRNVIDDTAHGGHFTADASLTAKFGAANNPGVTGTINNFRLNDGTEDPGWSVSLKKGNANNLTGTGGISTGNTTAWSINDNAADDSGAWSGQMYDEKPGNAPDGDGSNIPTTVTGTFYSNFDTAGRMVGAFGANKQ